MTEAEHPEQLRLPQSPKRTLSAFDWVMLLGIPVVAYFGVAGAAVGNTAGIVLTGFAALAMVAFRALRVGRKNEPHIAPWTHWLSIGVAVASFVTAWNAFRAAPLDTGIVFTLPLVPVALFFVLVIAVFRKPRP
uniref:hypothetical protein n=1 Tax=Pseudoclavibacter sp. RFBI5 TaxID=2080578 RepID=UPI002157846C|nr:hypothetical protein [Pseudoclavibacter sp. RFBI5]